MIRLALVNMPFADWNRPSFALSQLSGLLAQEFGDEVVTDVHYLNQDFAEYFGVRTYEAIAVRHDHVDTGVGDWMFRQVAFPDAPDNAEQYFHRFYRGEQWAGFRRDVLRLRAGLAEFCEELVDRYRLDTADVVGFSSMFAQHVPSIAGARVVKRRAPGVLTALGGANCEAPMGAVIAQHVPCVDYVFSGPALKTFPRFVRNVLAGRPEDSDKIPGIVSRRNCALAQPREAIGADRDINDVVLPDYGSFLGALREHPVLGETGTSSPMLFFETSRGCWWGQRSHCTFCGLNGQSMAYRSMDAELAVDQFNWLFGFAPEYTALFCTDNIMPRSYTKEVFPRLDPPAGTSIYYEVKLPLSRHDMATMSAAGVTAVQPGIEALATSTLKLMGKGTTAFHNIQFLKNCQEFGIRPDWNLLIGFPREDEEVYRRYAREIPKLTHLMPPTGVHMVRFDRFSPYFKRRDEFELDLHPMDFYALTYPFDDAALHQLAYFFADHNLAPYMVNSLEWHGKLREVVDAWRAAWPTDGLPRHELRMARTDAGGLVIRDSRPGTPLRHEIDEPMAELLRRLGSPTKVSQLADEWTGGAADLESRIDWLDGHDMLFEEGGRTLSLVVIDGEDPAPPEEERKPEPGNRMLLPLLPGEGAR